MKLSILCLALFVACGLSASAIAQKEVVYSDQAFNVSATSLPPKYFGHDPQVVYKGIEALNKARAKSEYETTAEYERRLASADQPIFGSLKTHDIFAFTIDPLSLRITYNADSRMLRASLTEEFYIRRNRLEPQLKVFKTSRLDLRQYDSYIGSNAFGKELKIDKSSAYQYSIAFSEAQRPSYALDIEREPGVARDLKEGKRLGVLAVCKLVSPLITRDAHQHKPTINEPYDTILITEYIHVQLRELWLYDSETGQVLVKQKAADSSTDSAQSSAPAPNTQRSTPAAAPQPSATPKKICAENGVRVPCPEEKEIKK